MIFVRAFDLNAFTDFVLSRIREKEISNESTIIREENMFIEFVRRKEKREIEGEKER